MDNGCQENCLEQTLCLITNSDFASLDLRGPRQSAILLYTVAVRQTLYILMQ